MSNSIFFSIIIPTFNSEKIISSALKSLAAQEFRNFEILILDGLSTDRTKDVVHSFSSLQTKVKWFSRKDKGIYDAMNNGIDLAQGEWLYFLGSDDELHDTKILKMVSEAILNESKVDVVYGDVISKRFSGLYDGEFSLEKIFNRNICHQAIFLKKDIFKITGKFDLKYKIYADWDNNLKWFLSKEIVNKYISMVIANYADGGFSSLNVDKIFLKDKEYKFLKLSYPARGERYSYIRKKIKEALSKRDMKSLYKSIYKLRHVLKN